jgi:RimJ/RimL family protein N-acetyltransferase
VTARFPAAGLPDGDVVVREPKLADADALLAALNDEGIVVTADMTFYGVGLDEVRTLIAEQIPAANASGRTVTLVIADASSDALLGGVALREIEWERGVGEISYWLLPGARGRGVATRAARLLSVWGIEQGLERIQGYAAVDNAPSQRVLERAGFTREGVLRSLPRLRGGRGDSVLYSLLPGE